MVKKRRLQIRYRMISMLFLCAISVFLVGCSKLVGESVYTIQYTDDAGTHQITVEKGMPYAMEAVPVKEGYVFTGLYDAETGGTQYVTAMGASLSPYTDKKNIVLFPQFEAKEYGVILDYQGAPVTGERQFTVSYGDSLPELPKNLLVENKDFAGWYTAPDCGGVRVADQYGLIPVISMLNNENFDLSGEYVYLYAGFEAEKLTVTFCYEPGMDTEEMQVPYNTPVGKLVTDVRVDGKAVLAWSKTQGGEVFSGKVTDDMVLYAAEYAPVLEFDSNGGSLVSPIVARAGSALALPVPEKEMAEFSHWEDSKGNPYTAVVMPGNSMALKAVWTAKLVFDENGGSGVEDISEAAGSKITLPTPEKEGFLFAGWYTAEKEQYSSATMPTEGLVLKAGWYKEKSETVVVLDSTKEEHKAYPYEPSTNSLCYTFDYGKFFSDNQAHAVVIDWHIKLRTDQSTSRSVYVDLYSQKQVSSTYLMETRDFENVTDEYREFDFSTTHTVTDNFYLCFYTFKQSGEWWDVRTYLSDFYYTVHYPDTTDLYL